jgi:spermidine synthase
MLPATICAGMTLPLFTFILLRNGHGEKSIGQVYASNTVGAITGVIFTVFIGMPFLALKGSIYTGAVIDIVIGLALIKYLTDGFSNKRQVYALSIFLFCFLLASLSHQFDTRKMSSGVFRQGKPELDVGTEVIYHRDGKTASISVTEWDNKNISILTNGKSDASITMDDDLPPSSDESTMTLLAALPLSVHPEATRIANIGIGSGLTTHVALNILEVERVDTIEIEEAMVSGARLFKHKTEKAFIDPRSYIHLEDARTYLSTHLEKYDIIISEPSNPWVSGISSLYTHEFYDLIKNHLADNGIFVQWVHIYEFNLDLLVSILKSLSTALPYYNVYFADDGNLLILAGKDQGLGVPDAAIFNSNEMREQLSTIHIHNIEDIRFRFLGDQALYKSFLEQSDIPANSDYNPYLALNATKARFMKEDVSYILDVRLSAMPILGLLYETRRNSQYNISATQYYPSEKPVHAKRIYDYLSESIFSESAIAEIASMNFLFSVASRCEGEINFEVWINSLYSILSETVAYLPSSQLNEILNSITPSCDDIGLPSGYLDWLSLYKSLIEGDHRGVLLNTGNILRNGSFSNIQQKEFLLTGMLAALTKAQRFDQARTLWEMELKNIYDGRDIPIQLRLLVSMAYTSE